MTAKEGMKEPVFNLFAREDIYERIKGIR